MVGMGDAGFFPQFAHHGIAWIFVGVDAALRHLPFQSGQNDFRTIVAKAVADQHESGGIEQSNADIGTIGFIRGHAESGQRSASGANSLTTRS